MDRPGFVTPNGETLAASHSLLYLFPAVESAGFFFAQRQLDQRVHLPIAAQSDLPGGSCAVAINALWRNLCRHANAALPEGDILRAW